MKQTNKVNPGESRKPVCPRRIAEDANAWADRIRAERANRLQPLPAPVVVTVKGPAS